MPGQPLIIRLDDPSQEGKRLDAVLAAALPEEFSRSRLQALIKAGHVRIGGQVVKAKQAVVLGDEVAVTIPEAVPSEMRPEAMDLDILYEDTHLLVLDKPAGLVVHPGAGHHTGTLVNALLAHCGGLSTIGGEERPGIVHRLDKDTSGCMVIAKDDQAHHHLAEQFARRTVAKHYLAVVSGRPSPASGRVNHHIGRHPVNRQKMAVVEADRGKAAITDYHGGAFIEGATLVHCQLRTGRTHQIRVHMHRLGHPLLGDVIYGRGQKARKRQVDRLMLHSWILGFRHPLSGEAMIWRTPIPEEFALWLTDEQWLEGRAAMAKLA